MKDNIEEYIDEIVQGAKKKVEEQARQWTGTRSGRKKRRLLREQRYLDHARKYMQTSSPRKQREFIDALSAEMTVQEDLGRMPTKLWKRIRKDVGSMARAIGMVK